ncbi:hypothetical protein J4N42_14465 [Vibrio sp. SCSIO 43135]|uniref:hypothetical protein n=1 Tax=Vibrio sp. SCSIO 43135 TaxID=2819096 RepID=UPI0020763CA6|nr:hypothetical protein [Vibrio sp. SCSIO 43135]USD43382.1 hypothetical protein J4N42_14465 [Vibrio sp. SCSIO 43135]
MTRFTFRLSVLSLALVSPFALSHGNVDISNGSQIDVYVANENHHGHNHSQTEKAYGIEAVAMDEGGFFVYVEGETGAHEFYQLGAGRYFTPNEQFGLFAYGAYAQGGYADSNEVRVRFGLDYQANHELTLHARLGADYGNSRTTIYKHDHHDHSEDRSSSGRSVLMRADAGFSYELGHVAEFSYNYVIQEQTNQTIVYDNSTNLHYEARLTYTDTQLQPYVEYRQTTKAFDQHHFEESAVQIGVSFNY